MECKGTWIPFDVPRKRRGIFGGGFVISWFSIKILTANKSAPKRPEVDFKFVGKLPTFRYFWNSPGI